MRNDVTKLSSVRKTVWRFKLTNHEGLNLESKSKSNGCVIQLLAVLEADRGTGVAGATLEARRYPFKVRKQFRWCKSGTSKAKQRACSSVLVPSSNARSY